MQVTLNMAASLDGRVAGPEGGPIELSGPEDWQRVHQLRGTSQAILVGVGTILSDDPQLTARTTPSPEEPPLRVVLDSQLRTPPKARVLDGQAPTLVVTTQGHQQTRLEGADVVACGRDRVDLDLALETLEQRGVERLLVEGGPTVAAALLRQGLVDAFHLYLAPRVLGTGPLLWSPLEGTELDLGPADAAPLGEGVLLSYEALP